MNLNAFSEFGCDGFSTELGSFRSMQGRLCCFKKLIQKIISLPFVLLFKAIITLFRGIGFLFGALRFIASLGSSLSAQEFFARRGSIFAKDLADWITLPFIVVMGFFRLFLGSTVHPAVYFR